MPEWISVKDRLPSIGEDVLVYDGEWFHVDYLNNSDSVDWGRCFDVTHWMPLPNAPESSNK